MAHRKISAKELIADIRARMSDEELAKKYAVSAQALQRLFQQLLDKGLITTSDLTCRTSGHAAAEEVPLPPVGPDKPGIAQPLPPPEPALPVKTGDAVTIAQSNDMSCQPDPQAVITSAPPAKSETDVAGYERVPASRGRSPRRLFGRVRSLSSAFMGLLVSLFTGRLLLMLVAYLFVAGLFALSAATIWQRYELELIREAQSLVRVDPLPKAKELYAAGEMCDALEHLEYFLDFDYVKENREITRFYHTIREERDSWGFTIKEIGKGIWSGKGACPEAIYSATASDLVGIGSLRTLGQWGIDFFSGNQTDDFNAALAAVDALATGLQLVGVVGTIGTGGLGAPAGGTAVVAASSVKTTVSSLRIMDRLRKLPRPLRAALLTIFQESYRLKSVAPIKKVVKSISRINDVPGLKVRDVFKVVSYAKDTKDLERLSHVAHAFGNKTGKFLTLGKGKSIQVYEKFHRNPQMVPALNEAVQYGEKGPNLLLKMGPQKFLKVLAPNQVAMGARTLRSILEGHLTKAAVFILKLIPAWALFLMAALSGIVTLGMPIMGAVRAYTRLRAPA